MRRVRRAAHVFFRLADELLPDIELLLRGEVGVVRQTRFLAASTLTGRELDVSPSELELLRSLPDDRWTDAEAVSVGPRTVDPRELETLAEAGLIVCDASEGRLAELRRYDDRLRSAGWDPYAAMYHSVSRWRDVDAGAILEMAPPLDARRSQPPPAFHASSNLLHTHELPLLQPDDGLFRLLRSRKTTRGLDPSASLTEDELALLLYHTFGCQGFVRVADGVVLLKRTSPSGGSLHPIEVYPLVIRVDGVATGLYHYRSDRHALDLLHPLEVDDARAWLVEFAAGQTYLGSASVLLVMTARFARSFWKYRSSPRAYGVVLMDAAHISQTLYLVSAELGLGAFVSAAVNGANIDERLGLDGVDEGALAVCGCGRPAMERSSYDTEFKPYVPRSTVLGADV